MKYLRKILDAAFIVAGVVLMTLEIWRDRSQDYRVIPEVDIPSGPPLPDDEELYDQFPIMWPIFSTRPASRMVN